MSDALVTQETIESRILIIRGHKVMIDRDLAELYGVSTKSLNQQVKRNIERFPANFMFQLSEQEKTEVVTICDHLSDLRFSHQLPYAFTEHGVAMLSSVLNSDRAVKMSIFIINTFIRLRQILYSHKGLSEKLDKIEERVLLHDKAIIAIDHAISELSAPKPDKEKKIGFLKE
jgi:ORF6N domain